VVLVAEGQTQLWLHIVMQAILNAMHTVGLIYNVQMTIQAGVVIFP